ncbi:MAG TPA: hypothetical protein VMT54_19430 [Candidatus Cybelea sp.]|nr:hypothetical protein [Candidatus Cybelea sp.]
MRRMMLAVAMLGSAMPAFAQDQTAPAEQAQEKPLTGSFYMAPPMESDDPKAPNDHIFLTITGDAAKSMWDAMKAKVTPDECIGRMSKWVNDLICYGPAVAGTSLAPTDSPFECYLGINLKTATLEVGQDC